MLGCNTELLQTDFYRVVPNRSVPCQIGSAAYQLQNAAYELMCAVTQLVDWWGRGFNFYLN